ncbi:WcaG Nucleoside-diphosphate-sugar epimerases [Candidatus Nanopelagicaceae bacterium]
MNFTGKKILITGHTGFKGTWLAHLLSHFGANLYGVSLPPSAQDAFPDSHDRPTMIDRFTDIRNFGNVRDLVQEIEPDLVFHLAAQSLVLVSYESPLTTYETNVMGTANLLEALRVSGNECSVIVVTTDKVYKNIENNIGYSEEDPLGGLDPYSGSKSSVEILVNSWRETTREAGKLKLMTVRSGNVIGGGDNARNRIIPDLIRSFRENKPALIRNPESVRPWQHVLDTLYGYLLAAESLGQGTNSYNSYNFGPDYRSRISVFELANQFAMKWPNACRIEKLESNVNSPKETQVLWLNPTRAIEDLQWQSILDIDDALDSIVEWECSTKQLGFFDRLQKQTKNYLEQVKL